MASMSSRAQSDIWPPELSDAADLDDRNGGRRRPSFGKRVVRTLFTLGIGVAGTLAWQSYGDTAREMVASAAPQLSWLAPQPVTTAQAAPEAATQAALATSAAAPDQQQLLNATSLGLAAVRQSIDRLGAQLAASQQQMGNEVARLQATDQEILQKIAAPQVMAPPPRPAAPARKPVAQALPPPPAAAPVPVR